MTTSTESCVDIYTTRIRDDGLHQVLYENWFVRILWVWLIHDA